MRKPLSFSPIELKRSRPANSVGNALRIVALLTYVGVRAGRAGSKSPRAPSEYFDAASTWLGVALARSAE
jgi:hypothetical protein